jgi:hypothetical protein
LHEAEQLSATPTPLVACPHDSALIRAASACAATAAAAAADAGPGEGSSQSLFAPIMIAKLQVLLSQY